MAMRVIACDLDGTLTVDGRPPSERVCRAVARCRDAGVRVVLATGRPPHLALPAVVALGLTGVHVFNTGAVIQDVAGPVHRRSFLDRRAGRAIIRECVARGLAVAVHARGRVLAPAVGAVPPLTALAVARGIAEEATLDEALAVAPVQITVGLAGAEEQHALEGIGAPWVGRVALTRAGPAIYDVVPAGVDKGVALTWLARRWGVETDEVAALGDGENDLPLFAAAGIRIAVGSTSSALASAADVVVPSAELDGAADALDGLLG